MRKYVVLFVLSLIWLVPAIALADGHQGATALIDQQFEKQFHHYQPHSVEILDSLTTTADVTTEDNVTKPKRIQVVLAQGKELKDTIFYFNLRQIYYYDPEENELLDIGSVKKNNEIKTFEKQYKTALGRHITPSSLTILLVMIFVTITAPPMFGALYTKHSSSSYKLQLEQTNGETFKY